MSEYCEKCGLMLVTPEAQAVLDLIRHMLTGGAGPSSWMGKDLIEAGERYVASLRPAPRYIVQTENSDSARYFVWDTHERSMAGTDMRIVGRSNQKADAEKIAAALNAAEEK